MPTTHFFGAVVRMRPMLDAIGAQETLEHFGQSNPPEHTAMCGPSRVGYVERQRMVLARRRNAAEARLRADEHAAWVRWRAARGPARAVGYAALTGK